MSVRAVFICGVPLIAAILIGVQHHRRALARGAKAETEKILKNPITEFSSDGERFEDTLARLGAETRLRFDVRWNALHAAGVEKEWPIDLRVYQRDVARTLEDVLDSAGGGNARLAFRVGGDGRVVVTTMADDVVARVYDVSRFFEPGFDPKLEGEALIGFLTDELDRRTWQDHGRNVARMVVPGGHLVCVTSTRNQEKIELLLAERKYAGAIRTRIQLTSVVATFVPLVANEVPLAHELDSLSSRFGLRLDVRWDTLRSIGVSRDEPVSMSLGRGVRLQKALSVILDSVSGGERNSTPAWYVSPDGSIVVTSPADAFARLSRDRVYDLRDFIFAPPLSSGVNRGPTREDEMNSVERQNRDTVGTDSWAGTAHGSATLVWHGLRLYVRQTAENHKQIEDLLELLREEKLREKLPLPRNHDMLMDDGRQGPGN